MGGIEDDGMGDLVAVRERDRDGVVRIAVAEVDRAVERIDDPLERVLAGAIAAGDLAHDLACLLADDRVLGKCGAQGRDHRVLGFGVGVADDVGVILGVRRPPLQVARHVDEHGGGAARRVNGNGEDRISVHCLVGPERNANGARSEVRF